MADPYTFLDDRLRAVLFEGRGTDGALGADAQDVAIPAGRFRVEVDQAPLTSQGYPGERFDRALRWEWEETDLYPRNPCDSDQLVAARLTVTHGVVYGDALARWLQLATGETEAVARTRPKVRLLDDARRICAALESPALVRDGTEVDPIPVGCEREGNAVVTDLGGGRMVATSVYLFTFRTSLR